MSVSPNLNDCLQRAHQVIVDESAAVLSAAESLDQKFVDVAQVLLACSGKVLITGSGTSGTIAKRAAHLFSVGGTPSLYLSPDDGLHGGLGVLRKNDVVIAISKVQLNRILARLWPPEVRWQPLHYLTPLWKLPEPPADIPGATSFLRIPPERSERTPNKLFIG